MQITVTSKADSLFPVVSAASIVAKVTRDDEVDNWKFNENLEKDDRDFGSGYPADPNTKKWLTKNFDRVFGLPDMCRFSWGTVKNLMEENLVKKVDIDVNLKDDNGNDVMSMDSQGEDIPKLTTKTVKGFVEYDFEVSQLNLLNKKMLTLTKDDYRMKDNRFLIGKNLRKIGYNTDFVL